MAKLTLASVDALRTRFADDAACDAALAAFADIAALRAVAQRLVHQHQRHHRLGDRRCDHGDER